MQSRQSATIGGVKTALTTVVSKFHIESVRCIAEVCHVDNHLRWQFGYALGYDNEVLRTGPVTNCVAISFFNRHAQVKAQRGALFHVALENLIYILKGPVEKRIDSDVLQHIIIPLSDGNVSAIEANLLSGFKNAFAFGKNICGSSACVTSRCTICRRGN